MLAEVYHYYPRGLDEGDQDNSEGGVWQNCTATCSPCGLGGADPSGSPSHGGPDGSDQQGDGGLRQFLNQQEQVLGPCWPPGADVEACKAFIAGHGVIFGNRCTEPT